MEFQLAITRNRQTSRVLPAQMEVVQRVVVHSLWLLMIKWNQLEH